MIIYRSMLRTVLLAEAKLAEALYRWMNQVPSGCLETDWSVEFWKDPGNPLDHLNLNEVYLRFNVFGLWINSQSTCTQVTSVILLVYRIRAVNTRHSALTLGTGKPWMCLGKCLNVRVAGDALKNPQNLNYGNMTGVIICEPIRELHPTSTVLH